jgi:aminopeptidase N
MKWFVAFFLFVSIKTNAQQTLCKQFTNIAAMEQQAFLSHQNARTISQASSNFKVNFYRCTWKCDPAIRYIDGKVVAQFTTNASTNNIAFDLTTQLTVDSVVFRNQKIGFLQQANQTLAMQFPVTLNALQKDSVAMYYHGVPDNTGFGSFIQTTHNNVPVIWTLSEPYGSKDWWPCRSGMDDKTDSIDITIIHPSQYKASSNGLLQTEITSGATTTTFFKHRYPIASYLVAISVTNFVVFNNTVQLGNVTLPMITYVYPESLTTFQAATYQVLDAMQLFHNTFAPYPFIKEKYGHTQFGWGGGMEHQTNTFITHTDANLMAHELGHQWFGDKITCGSWQDVWLNEGFATFAANYYFEKFDTALLRLILTEHLRTIVSLPDGMVWIKDTTEVARIFDGRLSYNKGGYALRMLRFTLGDSIFFRGMRQYQNDTSLQYRFARTADFKRNMETVSNKNLDYFFQQWIYGEGYPSFTVSWNQNRNNWAKINVREATSHASVSFFKTPLALTFKNATQQKTIVVQCNSNGDESWADIGFVADTVLVDKDIQLISKGNKTIKLQPSIAAQNEIKIYPNPVVNQLSISIKNPSEKQASVQLYLENGQLLFNKIFETPGQDELLQIPFTFNAHGNYILKVDAGSSIHVIKKIIK